jgi:hypothetical protein
LAAAEFEAIGTTVGVTPAAFINLKDLRLF